jgi:hypothetical protein
MAVSAPHSAKFRTPEAAVTQMKLPRAKLNLLALLDYSGACTLRGAFHV